MNKLAELSIKDFKAIKQADIHLDGISVVSGVNENLLQKNGDSIVTERLRLILKSTKKEAAPVSAADLICRSSASSSA